LIPQETTSVLKSAPVISTDWDVNFYLGYLKESVDIWGIDYANRRVHLDEDDTGAMISAGVRGKLNP
jgi:hypothetical protein